MAKTPAEATAARDNKAAAIEALLTLAAEQDWDEFGLSGIASHSGMTLAELRGLFPSKGAILAAYAREVDKRVLEGIDDSMAGEPARERLFDVLMRRIDMLKPHKIAIGRIRKSFRRDPLSALAWNSVATNSMQWMLEAAAIHADGPGGALRAQGLAIAWHRIVGAWLEDEDEGLARTMKAVDAELRRGERFLGHLEDFERVFKPFGKMAESMSKRRSERMDRAKERIKDMMSMRPRRPREEAAP